MYQGFAFISDLLGSVSLADGDTPSPFVPGGSFQLAKTGTFYSPVYGKIDITQQTLRSMYDNFKTKTPKAPTQLPIDYDHLSDDPKKPEDGKAAGWIDDLELRDDGTLWAKPSWTKSAARLIANGEYRFISPFFLTDYLDKDTNVKIGPTLKAAAITNRPFLEGMQPIPAPSIAASEKIIRAVWKNTSVAVPQGYKLQAQPARQADSDPDNNESFAAWRTGLPNRFTLKANIVRVAHRGVSMADTTEAMCETCGAPSLRDGQPIAWADVMADQAGAITCPHCGAPVKYVVEAAPPAVPGMPTPPGTTAPGLTPPGTPPGVAPMGTPGAGPHATPPPPPGVGDPLASALKKSKPTESGDAPAPMAPPAVAPPAAHVPPAVAPAVMPPVPPAAAGLPPAVVPVVPPPIDPTKIKEKKFMSDAALADEVTALREQLDASARQLSETQTKLTEHEEREKQRQTDDLLQRGLREGKLTPKMVGKIDAPTRTRQFAMADPTGFATWLDEEAPTVVDLKERGTATEAEGEATAVGLSEQINNLTKSELAEMKKENPHATYADAARAVTVKHRSLAERYDREMSLHDGKEVVSVVSSQTSVA